jgi:hypothetical protein
LEIFKIKEPLVLGFWGHFQNHIHKLSREIWEKKALCVVICCACKKY